MHKRYTLAIRFTIYMYGLGWSGNLGQSVSCTNIIKAHITNPTLDTTILFY